MQMVQQVGECPSQVSFLGGSVDLTLFKAARLVVSAFFMLHGSSESDSQQSFLFTCYLHTLGREGPSHTFQFYELPEAALSCFFFKYMKLFTYFFFFFLFSYNILS